MKQKNNGTVSLKWWVFLTMILEVLAIGFLIGLLSKPYVGKVFFIKKVTPQTTTTP